MSAELSNALAALILAIGIPVLLIVVVGWLAWRKAAKSHHGVQL